MSWVNGILETWDLKKFHSRGFSDVEKAHLLEYLRDMTAAVRFVDALPRRAP